MSRTTILNHRMHNKNKNKFIQILNDKSLCEYKRKLIIKTIPLYFLLYNSVKDPVIIIIFIVIVIFNYRSCVFWARIPRKPIQIGQRSSPSPTMSANDYLTCYKSKNKQVIFF